MCDLVTGSEAGSQAILETLERSNLFTFPLDDDRRWYRYHHLFAGLLRARLLQTSPELAPVLHRRAAIWLEQNGQAGEAVRHALAAGDHTLAADLLQLHGTEPFMKTFLRRYALPSYFFLAYLIPWGGSLLIAGSRGFQAASLGSAEFGLMILLMLLGPSSASLGLTSLLDGKEGLRKLFSPMRRWQIGWRWWTVVCLTVPLLSVSALMLLTFLVSPLYQVRLSLSQVGAGLAIGLLAGLAEETGWTGFALPRLQARYSPLASALVLGTLWAIWHGMADFWGNTAALGPLWLPNFIAYWLVPLIAYRILIVWVHKNTASLLAAQVMHAFYTGTLVAVSPVISPTEGMLWKALFAALLWLCMTGVVIRFGERLAPKPD